jgi:hypothetical protein
MGKSNILCSMPYALCPMLYVSWLLNSFFLWCLVPIPILPAAGCLLPAFTYEIRWRILSGMSKLA